VEGARRSGRSGLGSPAEARQPELSGLSAAVGALPLGRGSPSSPAWKRQPVLAPPRGGQRRGSLVSRGTPPHSSRQHDACRRGPPAPSSAGSPASVSPPPPGAPGGLQALLLPHRHAGGLLPAPRLHIPRPPSRALRGLPTAPRRTTQPCTVRPPSL
jgi:hypothetical protein